MDMNWQAMLREAANASFEKDIQTHAAAEYDASSCVDLPQGQIRALSEKLLQLPHQGITLVLSRYCFRLSPEETELFFRIKNAKGCFRFYRALLSSCMGLRPDQVISDASFQQACKIALKDYLRRELKKDPAIPAGKSRMHIAFRRLGKAAAVAAITLTLLFSTALMTNAQIREKVMAWVVEKYEQYSIFELQGDGETERPDWQRYQPSYLPEGANLQGSIELPESIIYEYILHDSSYFRILLSQSDTQVYADSENAEIHTFDQDGVTGYFFEKDDLNYICYERDGYFFSLYGTVDMNELIKIAAGIKAE